MKKKWVNLPFSKKEKLLIVMKLTGMFLFLGLMEVSASVYSQNTKLTLDLQQATVEQVLNAIEAQSKFTFLYRSDYIRELPRVNIKTNKVRIERILDKILVPYGLTYEITDNTVVLRKDPSAEGAIKPLPQEIEVSGSVTDGESDAPMPGVSVQVKGTATGTVTDIDGNYRISVDDRAATLIFSFIGFKSQEIAIDGRNTIDIQLMPDIESLENVVVVGYGTVKKSEFAGAATTVNAGEIERVPVTNPLLALQGKAAGLSINPSSGQPGASNNVVIRGFQSINGSNSPIYVVDGTITESIDNLNSQDIESITVLKDASSVAIYGSRAANGVIMVTTKRGTNAKTPRISFSTSQSVQQQGNLRVDYLNADQWLELLTEAHENTNGSPVTWTDADLAVYEGVDVDWPNAVMRNGSLQTYDLSVAGSGEYSNYLVTGGYLTNTGIIKGQDFSRLNLRINTDHKINDFIEFGNSLNLYSTEQNDNIEIDGRNVYTAAFRYTPLNRKYEEDGDFGIIRNSLFEGRSPNPLWMLSNTARINKDKGLLGNLYLTLNLLDGLKFTARGSLEWSSWNREDFLGATSPHYGTEGSNVNQITKENRETTHWIGDFLLDYNKVFNEKHSLSVLLGYSVEENTWENLWGRRGGTPNNSIRFLDSGDPLTSVNGNGYSDWAFISTFGRLRYSFMDKYTISAVVRRDGTSRLAKGEKYGTFPSVSAAWRISNEEFLKDTDWLDELKLRGSWGTVGNVGSIDTYGTTTILSQWNYHLNQQPVIGYTLADAVNTDLIWESTTKRNVGFDAYLFNSTVYLIGDFFIEDTENLLFEEPLPYSTGYAGFPFINAAQVRNKGFDLELGYRKALGDWSLNVSANVSHFKNEVIKLDGKEFRTNGIVEGEPLFSAFGYKTGGIIRTEGELASNPQFAGKEVGDISFLDINGRDEEGNLTGNPDGEVNEADRTLIGSVFPDFSYGAFASVSYKNFTLQLQLQGVSGVDRDMRGGRATDAFTSEPNVEADYILDRFHETKNPDGDFPEVSKDDAGQNGALSDFWLRDASYMSIRNINLNYDLPGGLVKRAGLQNFSIYVGVQNLYTFTSLYGTGVDVNFNPEFGGNTNPESGNNITSIPLPRVWTLGLKATF